MNHRYLRIIVTCAIVGTLTLALKQNNNHIGCSACALNEKKEQMLKTSLDADAQPIAADPVKKTALANTITIEPDISSKDLAYKHGFFSYSPTSIILSVNGEEIEVNNDDPITVKVESSLTVTTRCKYTFIANHKGEHLSTWKVKPGQKYTVTFDWKVPEKIQLDGAELVSTRKLTSEESKELEEKERAQETDETNEETAIDVAAASKVPALSSKTATANVVTSPKKCA